jgi:hypothetical protein
MPSNVANAEIRRLRRAEQFKKRLAVIETIGRPGGVTNKELCDEFNFRRISIRKQAKFLSLDIKYVIDQNGRERYSPASPLPSMLSMMFRFPSGNELHIHGLTPEEAAELNRMDSK